ncbi:MAG TPA: hypothetical protein PLR64_03430 [Candidatus Dojkabacteria bacterium]|nr:hypothetical protein [Candidatus Dojkabacteria bacterium]
MQLGKTGKDKITGLEGIIIGRCEYLYGCTQYCLLPKATDNKAPDGTWYDEGRIEIIDDGIKKEEVKGKRDGGPSCGPASN